VSQRVLCSTSERFSWSTWFNITELKSTQTVAPASAALAAATPGSVEISSTSFTALTTSGRPSARACPGGSPVRAVAAGAIAAVAGDELGLAEGLGDGEAAGVVSGVTEGVA
jgi:hypothetical protein